MLEIQKPEGPSMLVSDRRLCLDAWKLAVVESRDPRAAYLLVCEGGSLAVSEAEKYGLRLVDGKFVLPNGLMAAEPEAESELPNGDEDEGA